MKENQILKLKGIMMLILMFSFIVFWGTVIYVVYQDYKLNRKAESKEMASLNMDVGKSMYELQVKKNGVSWKKADSCYESEKDAFLNKLYSND